MRAAVSFAVAIAWVGTATADDRMSRAIGKALFERAWVPAPSSTKANDGLGPLFNARACSACHDGLERMPVLTNASGTVESENLVLRFSDKNGQPDPMYGRQLQTSAVPGLEPEGRIAFGEAGPFPSLMKEKITSGFHHSARLAPALRGLGQLEAVSDDVILKAADPDDRDGDGISGRANLIGSDGGDPRVGRFGWKASASSLSIMTETAFSLDLGLSTPGRLAPWGDCGERQAECRAAPHGGNETEPEITGEIVSMIRDYLMSIAPPAPKADPNDRIAGEGVFASTGCASCHMPSLPSPKGPVHAYTDLLLHDMGADLGGGATEPGVAASEWRTAPLWGLSQVLASGARLLHDGRAASLDEAIRAHGGEGAGARSRYHALSLNERSQLLAFLSSL